MLGSEAKNDEFVVLQSHEFENVIRQLNEDKYCGLVCRIPGVAIWGSLAATEQNNNWGLKYLIFPFFSEHFVLSYLKFMEFSKLHGGEWSQSLNKRLKAVLVLLSYKYLLFLLYLL